MKKINEKLKEYRKSLGLSQEYVAKQLGVHRTTITAIELGTRKVLAEEIDFFADMYGVSIEEIIHEETYNGDVKVFARAFSKLSEKDQKEIMNLIDFKNRMISYTRL